MKIPPKSREDIVNEFNYSDTKMLMRRLKKVKVELPERVLLSAPEQKRIYEGLYYPKGVKKEWYEDF